LVLFDPATVRDTASFADPVKAAAGIDAVWVNGVLSYRDQASTGQRGGRFLPRQAMRADLNSQSNEEHTR
jgi:N-acyl-D-aspartate/D-glutamate deacylase